MLRTFGLQTIGSGTSQPWFADALTAALVFNANLGTYKMQVASTANYQVGDRILLDPGATDVDIVIVDNIPAAQTTVMNVKSEGGAPLNAHANGTVICLSLRAAKIRIQAKDGNTGTLWIGADKTVTSTGTGSAVFQLQKVALAGIPVDFIYEAATVNNGVGTADGWIAGTAGDKFVACAEIN